MREITIIGAGLSGTLLAINLLGQKTSKQINIKLIDRRNKNDLGPAYSTNEDYLLNVPAEMMGAFSIEPDHFLNWTLKKKINTGRGDYLPRKFYREYIKEMYQQALIEKSENISIERIEEEVVNIRVNNSKPVVCLKDNSEFTTDKVVLALGNAPPRNPEINNRFSFEDKRYIQNPWDLDIFENISADNTIFFIGTGQTTVDLVTGLNKRKHRGKMICISRRGIFPMVHKKVELYTSFFDELEDLTDILSVFRVVRKHLRIAEGKGLDPRAVIDSLRPYTKAIWMNLPPVEKKRFLRHVFRYWEIIRSRIPPVSDEIISRLRSSGQMKVISGRISNILPLKNKMEIKYTERVTFDEKSESADFVINCIGPCQDYDLIDQPLIKNLLKSRLIQCDPVHLGINALQDCSVISDDGTPSDILYTIGLPLKGIVWESLAAPEIRVEAEGLSKILVNGL